MDKYDALNLDLAYFLLPVHSAEHFAVVLIFTRTDKACSYEVLLCVLLPLSPA